MEASGVVSRQVPSFSGAGIDTSRPSAPSIHGGVRVPGRRDFGVSLRTGGFSGRLSSGFRDDGHVQYYQAVGAMCGGGKIKEKEKEIKKKMKLIKGLKELASSSQMGFGSGLVAEIQGKLISEGGEALLLEQLEQLRAEEKEMKKRRKEEKARLKAERMKAMVDGESSSSSSSSESSDGECGEAVHVNRLRGEVPAQPMPDSLPAPHQGGALLALPGSLTENEETVTMGHGIEVCSSQTRAVERCIEVSTRSSNASSSGIGLNGSLGSSVAEVSSGMKIEVCMGSKCKKSGGGALLEEFERVMNGEATVVGCKCMGKCKNGPNVRVSGTLDGIKPEGRDDYVRTPVNPLYIGVGLEDVSLIVSNLIGEDKKDLGLVVAA